MNNDDIAPLYDPPPDDPAPMSLRQGIVQSWDADTGENTIQVAGATLVNLPSLTAESAELVSGDVVALLWSQDRALVIGKVTTPGDPGTVPSWSGDIVALQSDMTTVNTVTIPAVQADVATAQTAADAAQADATSALGMFPITATDIQDGAISTPKLAANAIDGLTITGNVIRTAATGHRVEINDTYADEISFHTDRVTEVAPGRVGPQWTLDASLTTTMDSPVHSAVVSGLPAEIVLETNSSGKRNIYFNADKFVFDDSNPLAFVQTDWTAIPLSGTWVDAAGARAHYMKDEIGRVSLRGLVISGGAATIGTLPAGFRPSQTMEWIMRGGTGVVLCAISVATTGVITVTANAATAQTSGVRLDSISFPAT